MKTLQHIRHTIESSYMKINFEKLKSKSIWEKYDEKIIDMF